MSRVEEFPNRASDGDGDPEFLIDQQQLVRADACLAQMKRHTEQVQEIAARAVRDENTVDARVAEAKLRQRRAALEAGTGPLCFGRIDEEQHRVGQPGARWYVGRRHVEDVGSEPVIVDWRAPVSAAFYRATAVDPCGLERRRRFSVDGTELQAVFDEDLTDPDAGGGLPDPLLADLDRSRSGQMRDIIATIAAEQDEIIRAPREELLVVQGGPGTGKTAVGLHRAAFLLFQHRDFFHDNKVLVVGPNPVFLRYVADVLPSLGETSVIQMTITGLLSGKHRIRSVDSDELIALKGDARLAAVIAYLIRSKVKPPLADLELRSGVSVIRFTPDQVGEFQQRALDRSIPYNTGRDVFRTILFQEAWTSYSARRGADPGAQPSFVAAIRNDPTFKKEFDRMWPMMSAAGIVRELLGSAAKRKVAAAGLLTGEEQQQLHRSSAKKASDEPWTAADLPLIDEATQLVSGVPATYGHVVVDEAQDHSAMALRMLGRRALGRSMTILGDLAQATAPGAMSSWEEAGEHLSIDGGVRQAELTVGYRVPAAILDVANRLLSRAAPSVTPAVSIRPGGETPQWFDPSEGDGSELDRLVAAVEAALADLPETVRSIAVIGVEADLDRLQEGLAAHDLERIGVGRVGGALPGAEAIALLDPDRAKGLEFDAVVLVRPELVIDSEHGLRRLYVAMTRAVQHLAIVGSDQSMFAS